jgi:hypothetical protein
MNIASAAAEAIAVRIVRDEDLITEGLLEKGATV